MQVCKSLKQTGNELCRPAKVSSKWKVNFADLRIVVRLSLFETAHGQRVMMPT
ncbi:hypothetical protein HMPREF9136_1751 [Prevotella dentalis DSM 3688]|uniref:Uncharacterized protein n=1 Tax=Prevotella dentalis (strain ATCC 49559 / DSM 3688 / JCM 13448 / NCTC 12043 / ES 2772) TaxID=908937 RepID=F9D4H3_PREDD|nr:hypothetical protein HMPREF9136_1751 [Prevotella dentalis DSM 3688]